MRTIRKHLTRTPNSENEITHLTDDVQRNFPKQTVTTVTIQRTLPANQTITTFNNNFPTNSIDFFKDKFPRQQNQDMYQQNQGQSSTYTTYHTRTVTVHSNSGARRFSFFFSFYQRICCLFWFFFFCT